MLDVEQPLSGWVVSGLDRRADSHQILRVNVADDFRQIGILIGIPAVHAAQLRRPVQRFSQVIVLENADVAGSNRLAQAFIGLAHTQSVYRVVPGAQLNITRRLASRAAPVSAAASGPRSHQASSLRPFISPATAP